MYSSARTHASLSKPVHVCYSTILSHTYVNFPVYLHCLLSAVFMCMFMYEQLRSRRHTSNARLFISTLYCAPLELIQYLPGGKRVSNSRYEAPGECAITY